MDTPDEHTAQRGQDTTRKIREDVASWSPLWISPDGRHLIFMRAVAQTPARWASYHDFWLQENSKTPGHVFQYELMDLDSGVTLTLLDAPANYQACDRASITWSPDGRAVLVAGNFLPLNVKDAKERTLREERKFIAEVRISSGEVSPVSGKELCPLRWDSGGKLLGALTHYYTQRGSPDGFVAFRAGATGWKEVAFKRSDLAGNARVGITLEEDINSPPKVFATDRQTGRKSLVWDFNPQFKTLSFGEVRDVSFEGTDGRTVHAGIYLPTDFVRERRYPLVIQTHGWDAQRFRIDGFYTSASAAQPLAGRGIAVMQLNEGNTVGSGSEYAAKASAYEGAIDYLDRMEMVDRERIGIEGFSRTGLGVEYVLTHSRYHFAAAVLADHSDGGYFAYISSLPERALEFETLNGGTPFGQGLASWVKTSPDFNLTVVTTPVREEAYSVGSVFWSWEWYAGLSRLSKPIELLYLPDEETPHALFKPRERMISQGGTFDWMRFWLQGYERKDPVAGSLETKQSLSEQYRRWEKLCDLQVEQNPDRPTFCVRSKPH